MTERIHTSHVGEPVPELQNSPVIDESAEDEHTGAEIESVESFQCNFNDVAFDHGALVCSGDELLSASTACGWLSAAATLTIPEAYCPIRNAGHPDKLLRRNYGVKSCIIHKDFKIPFRCSIWLWV